MKTKSTLFFFAVALCLNINTAKAQVNVKDSLALVDLYNSTDGSNWSDHTNWLTSNSVSEWSGITVTDSTVTGINLSNKKLSGSIPSSIGNLVNLQQLNLSDNQLGDSIPSSIGNLVNLSDLDLSYNQLSGTIPSSITKVWRVFTNEYDGVLFLNNNRFTFDGMELVAQSIPPFSPHSIGTWMYAPQANISVHKNDSILSVYAGGTLSNNTYQWFNVEKDSAVTITGDSVFHPLQTGNYFAVITNSICTRLTLHTDTIFYGATHDILQDSLALVDLYNSTNGPNWNNHTNWLTTTPVSTWYGITVTNGRVTGISLESNALDGSIPTSIDYLEMLSSLGLDSNDLHGNITNTFNHLSHSLNVNLSDNHFTFDGMELIAQTFPNAVYAPQKLLTLHQEGNALSVSAGGTLGNNIYTWFNIEHNDSSTVTGDSVFHILTTGKYFAKITNAICRDLTLYTDTIYNDITTNAQDSLALVDLYNSTNGSNWYDHTNWLTKNPVITWYGVTVTNTRVTKIDFQENGLDGSIPSSIGNLAGLQTLVLSENYGLTGNIPSSIGNLVNLTDLNLDGNQLTGSVPSAIGNLKKLTELIFRQNQLSGHIPSSIGNLINLQNLRLDGNQLNGNIPSSIGNLVNLASLFLYYNQLDGSISSSIGNLVNLQNLSLFGNQLSGSIPSSIGNLVNLTELYLNNNQLTDSIPSSIGNLVNLTALSLYENNLSGSIPSSLGNLWRNPLYLGLGNNRLSGLIPSSLTNLHGLLDLSYNHLTFDGLELIVETLLPRYLRYGQQADISIYQNGNALSVHAGGTVSNNTYKWFRVEGKDTGTVIVGDSVFHPSVSGHYFLRVRNAICTRLTLQTDTIFYDATLPVTIINLKAQQQKSIIKIDWTSVTEINVSSYEIQRSSNALNFNTVGTLAAKGSGIQKVTYTFNDVQPLHGDNYYRIKAIDKDGKIIYSNTVLVNMNNDRIITVVYPNPAKDILHVETDVSAAFSLIDQSGKIMLTTNINGKGIINISGIAAGLYYLKNNTSKTIQKVVITR